MSRQVGDERARYGRQSLRERAEDLLAWPGRHPVGTVFLLAFVGVGVAIAGSRGLLVGAERLAAGDCLWVRVDANQGDERPIGEPRAVIDAVLAGRMEKAGCDASHGHEVSAVVEVPLPEPSGDPATEPSPGAPDRATIERVAQPACVAAFQAYVGRSLIGSRYVTFAVYPDPQAWLASGRRTICLVARADGTWMDRPARASAE